MNEIDRKTIVRRHNDASYRVIDGSALIVMPREAKLLTLNPVGSRVWELLDEGTVAQVAETISDEFEIGFDEALSDTLAFLHDLLERGMVIAERQ